jgi:hypothetical protein
MKPTLVQFVKQDGDWFELLPAEDWDEPDTHKLWLHAANPAGPLLLLSGLTRGDLLRLAELVDAGLFRRNESKWTA